MLSPPPRSKAQRASSRDVLSPPADSMNGNGSRKVPDSPAGRGSQLLSPPSRMLSAKSPGGQPTSSRSSPSLAPLTTGSITPTTNRFSPPFTPHGAGILGASPVRAATRYAVMAELPETPDLTKRRPHEPILAPLDEYYEAEETRQRRVASADVSRRARALRRASSADDATESNGKHSDSTVRSPPAAHASQRPRSEKSLRERSGGGVRRGKLSVATADEEMSKFSVLPDITQDAGGPEMRPSLTPSQAEAVRECFSPRKSELRMGLVSPTSGGDPVGFTSPSGKSGKLAPATIVESPRAASAVPASAPPMLSSFLPPRPGSGPESKYRNDAAADFGPSPPAPATAANPYSTRARPATRNLPDRRGTPERRPEPAPVAAVAALRDADGWSRPAATSSPVVDTASPGLPPRLPSSSSTPPGGASPSFPVSGASASVLAEMTLSVVSEMSNSNSQSMPGDAGFPVEDAAAIPPPTMPKATESSGSGSALLRAADGKVLLRMSVGKEPIYWQQGPLLGRGTAGEVYKALNVTTGKLMAVKFLSRRNSHGLAVDTSLRQMAAEVGLLRCLQHPNIVRYLGCEVCTEGLYVFLELVAGGGSIHAMLKDFGPFSEQVAARYTLHVTRGLAYLHELRVLHRDIKGANILVDQNGIAKLSDFGCSKQLDGAQTLSLDASLRQIRGTIPFMAPEVIQETGHGRRADVWSLGATVIEMLTGSPPWSEFSNPLSAMFHIGKGNVPKIPTNVSPEAQDFLSKCLQLNPAHRWTAEQLLGHPWLAAVPLD